MRRVRTTRTVHYLRVNTIIQHIRFKPVSVRHEVNFTHLSRYSGYHLSAMFLPLVYTRAAHQTQLRLYSGLLLPPNLMRLVALQGHCLTVVSSVTPPAAARVRRLPSRTASNVWVAATSSTRICDIFDARLSSTATCETMSLKATPVYTLCEESRVCLIYLL